LNGFQLAALRRRGAQGRRRYRACVLMDWAALNARGRRSGRCAGSVEGLIEPRWSVRSRSQPRHQGRGNPEMV